MANLYMMVGVPRSGKSTFSKQLRDKTNATILSADKLRVELLGQKTPIKEKEPFIWKTFYQRLGSLLSDRKDIIIDNTNVSVKSRKKILKKALSYDYNIEAFVLKTSIEEIRKRAKASNFPIGVINIMIMIAQMPSTQEGFTVVHIVDGE